ncbi:cell division control protein 7 [Nematocida homosporus]|uniref:cell division control protein 7 n=1 Tax=Nematocida homosporus TaxID=1912981 RepID=UPI00221F4DCA|nr:cell division control protein 7 [Nematocida homosporus]KAI5184633.1 cell division control protein 7 [Nematocida homosporus]
MEETSQWGRFKAIRKIGEGTFSSVFLVEDKKTCRELALKRITQTTAPSRIANELRYLLELKGERNIIELVAVVRDKNDVLMAFPYIVSTDFKEILSKRSLADIKSYMRELLQGLVPVHALGIIHRDIKPGNFLYNMETKQGCLIDFGLSQRVSLDMSSSSSSRVGSSRVGGSGVSSGGVGGVAKKQRFFFTAYPSLRGGDKSSVTRPPGYLLRDGRPGMDAARSGTRGFRAPEVLFRVENQTTAIDVWSAGVILLVLLAKKYPFFCEKDDVSALVELAGIFGGQEMREAARHYQRVWKSNIEECIGTKIPFRTVVKLCTGGNEMYPDSVFDLLDKMLALKDVERITAEEALRHRFFLD